MLRLLKIEWNKIYYYKAARVFTFIYFGLLILMGLFLSQFKTSVNGTDLDLAKLGAFDFPYIWQNITYFAAIGKIFLAVIIITNITNEYSNRTLKQNLIDGLSKKEFIQSKFLTTLVFSLLSTLFIFLIGLILGVSFSENSVSFFQNIDFIGAYFMKLVLFFSFCMFLSVLMKKTAFSFLMLFVWWVLESILGGVESFLRIKFFDQNPLKVKMVYNYLPLQTSSNLIKFPELSLEDYILGGRPFTQGAVDYSFFIVSVFYIIIFVMLSYILLKKRDL
ncbi:ABC transporter permease [Apibacter adventoris]|uniref:ABC transporter permease n=1 Tax=Apibacter adventoris TaxID=1679466 RepID=UPI000CF6294E|nr:ABC transporter permease [Apibacter adventoris]PQL92544.1 ABC transporter permease [Apibacter adventoris]